MNISNFSRLSFAGLALGLAMTSANALTAIGIISVDIENAASVPAGQNWLQVAEFAAYDFAYNPAPIISAVASNPLFNNGVDHWGTPAANAIDNSITSTYPEIYHASNLGESLRITFAAPTNLSYLTIYGRSGDACCGFRDVYNVTLNTLAGPAGSFTLDASGGKQLYSFTSPVPEPTELAMLVGGLGVVGLMAKRRRK
jgi:hypothetical protein